MLALQAKAPDTAVNLPSGALAKMHEMATKFDESLREAEEVRCYSAACSLMCMLSQSAERGEATISQLQSEVESLRRMFIGKVKAQEQ